MKVTVGSQIRIENPTKEVIQYCKSELELTNPDYVKKSRMGFWTGNTPRTLVLYQQDGNSLVLPYGCLRAILPMIQDAEITTTFKKPMRGGEFGKVPLYDYQEDAVKEVVNKQYGILQSPAGTGKTQMGIAIASELRCKTLWLTHTKDLLTQSYDRAAQYIDKQWLGTITEGKVNISSAITFATIQTMCRLDLEQYKDTWDVIIVDECHRVAGTPTAMTMFSKVLNTLRARHKYGLSATVHRADGMIKATFALLGGVVYEVPDEAIKDKIVKVTVMPVRTNVGLSTEFLNTDGTINYQKEISYLTGLTERNTLIEKFLQVNTEHYNLILSERVNHLNLLYNNLPDDIKKMSSVIDGKTKKEVREQAIEDMREGKKHYLFATYQLAKEGLDIPRLDRLYLTTPQKDYAVIVQSVGRVQRIFPGKKSSMVYDFVDAIKGLEKSFKKRCTSYRQCGCEVRR